MNHSAGEYVRMRFCHTNTIEGFRSLLFKRAVVGTYHHVSDKHLLDRYLAMHSFRYGPREAGEGDRVNMLLEQTNGRLTRTRR